MPLTLDQACQIFHFCILTHDALWEVNQGDEISEAFADGTGIYNPGEGMESFLERAEAAAQFLMDP